MKDKDPFTRVKESSQLIFLLLVLLLISYPYPKDGGVLGAIDSSKVGFSVRTKREALLSLDPVGQPSSLPRQTGGEDWPETSAEAVVVLEPQSGMVLGSQKSEHERSIASLTKLMTAWVAANRYSRDQEIVVDNVEGSGSQMGLKEGERVTVRSLIWGLLLNSGNDAAELLASGFPGGKVRFVEEMNREAQELRLAHSHYYNSVGWDHPQHYSSALDVALLTEAILEDEFLAEIISTPEKVVTSVPRLDREGREVIDRWYHLDNTHPLLGEVEGVQGGKTGYTAEAGQCLVTYVRRLGRPLVVVVLGSEDRAEDSRRLIEWAYRNWQW